LDAEVVLTLLRACGRALFFGDRPRHALCTVARFLAVARYPVIAIRITLAPAGPVRLFLAAAGDARRRAGDAQEIDTELLAIAKDPIVAVCIRRTPTLFGARALITKPGGVHTRRVAGNARAVDTHFLARAEQPVVAVGVLCAPANLVALVARGDARRRPKGARASHTRLLPVAENTVIALAVLGA